MPMGPLDVSIHLLNFAAPAVFVAALTALLGRLLWSKRPSALMWWSQLAINFAVCLAASAFGLWFFGRDGMMATYGALVLGCATSQWVMMRGWTRF